MQTINLQLFDREEMTDDEKNLFMHDLGSICEEYFQNCTKLNLDITRTEDGFSVCVIFNCTRIKRFKKPL
jgi:hypothetical protein